MKTLYKVLVLIIIDFGLIWFWVYQMDPDPSISIGILLLVPFVFVLNLMIGGVLFFIKKKEHSKLFFINSVLASIIMIYLFDEGIDRHQNNRLESWEFHKSDTIFRVTRYKKVSEFSMSYSTNPGSSSEFLNGKCELENSEWVLTTDSTRMKIYNNFLIGFRTQSDTITLEKLKR